MSVYFFFVLFTVSSSFHSAGKSVLFLIRYENGIMIVEKRWSMPMSIVVENIFPKILFSIRLSAFLCEINNVLVNKQTADLFLGSVVYSCLSADLS